MGAVQYRDDLANEVPMPEPLPEHHKLLVEMAARVQEMDAFCGRGEGTPEGVKFMRRMVTIYQKSPDAYDLVLDLLAGQEALSMSLAKRGGASQTRGPRDEARQLRLAARKRAIKDEIAALESTMPPNYLERVQELVTEMGEVEHSQRACRSTVTKQAYHLRLAPALDAINRVWPAITPAITRLVQDHHGHGGEG